MQLIIASIFTMATAAMAAPGNHLLARGDGEIVCGPSTIVTRDREREDFVEGQSYLKGLGAVCGAEARKCARVSCSNNAAVWLCNNTDEEITGLECGIMSDYVDHIFDKCQEDGMYAVDYAVGIQRNTDGWFVQAGMNVC